MKRYKLLNGLMLEEAEEQINQYAQQGWAVKAFNVVPEAELNQDKWAFVLLEIEE